MMAHSPVDDFEKDLRTRSLEWVANHYIFEGTPYIFRDRPEIVNMLSTHLSRQLELSSENIRIIGSAKVGFSLSPDNFPREFSNTSDIDVLVVDEKLFDEIWMSVLNWHYPRRLSGLGRVDSCWMSARRNDLYWGWFHPDRIKYKGLSLPEVLKPLRDISTSWFNAFRSLSRYPEFSGRHVSGRLYRSWSHARLYHLDALRKIKETVLNVTGG